MFRNIAILLAAVAASACSSTGQLVPLIAQDDPLPTGSADQVGLDLTVLTRISAELAASDDHDIHSILAVRSGLLTFEGELPRTLLPVDPIPPLGQLARFVLTCGSLFQSSP